MWYAREVAQDALFRLIFQHPPPSWHTELHRDWALGMQAWYSFNGIHRPVEPPAYLIDFFDVKPISNDNQKVKAVQKH